MLMAMLAAIALARFRFRLRTSYPGLTRLAEAILIPPFPGPSAPRWMSGRCLMR
jgi:hypothetical protein